MWLNLCNPREHRVGPDTPQIPDGGNPTHQAPFLASLSPVPALAGPPCLGQLTVHQIQPLWATVSHRGSRAPSAGQGVQRGAEPSEAQAVAGPTMSLLVQLHPPPLSQSWSLEHSSPFPSDYLFRSLNNHDFPFMSLHLFSKKMITHS